MATAEMDIKKSRLPHRSKATGAARSFVRRYHRLLRLQQLLVSGELFDVSSLGLELNVTRRTVFRDLALLRDAGVAIPRSGRNGSDRVCARSLVQTSSAAQLEAVSILVVSAFLSPVETIPQCSAKIRVALAELIKNWPNEYKREISRLIRACRMYRSRPLIETIDDRVLTEVLAAIRGNYKVRLTIRRQNERTWQTKVSPYCLETIDSALILTGRSTVHRNRYSFRLSDVEKAEAIDESFTPPARLLSNREQPQRSMQRIGRKM
jgi:predicted DNA-binding transcriptional regulator YafY